MLGVRRDYFTATVARCIYAFITGGSMKTYGVLTEYIVNKLDIPHSVIGSVLALQQSVGYLAGPVISVLTARYGCRPIAIFGGFFFGLGYIGQAILNEHLYWFIIFCAISGFGCGCISYPTYLYLHRVYGNRFGLVQSITSQFIFIGVCVVPLWFTYLWDHFGLQGALCLFGAFCWHYVVAGVMLSPIDKKGDVRQDDNQWRENTHILDLPLREIAAKFRRIVTGRQSQRCLLIIVFCHFACYFSWALFLIPVAQSRGHDKSAAVILSTAGGLGGIAGRLGSTVLFAMENTSKSFNFLIPNLVQCLAFVGIAFSHSLPNLLLFSSISGITLGFTDGVLPGFIPLNLSAEDIPVAIAIHFIVYAVGMESGTFLAGFCFDYYQTYTASFIFLGVISMVAAVTAIVWNLCEYEPTTPNKESKDVTKVKPLSSSSGCDR